MLQLCKRVPQHAYVQKAAQLEAQEEAGREEFNFGVALYERGRYQESESMLRTALDVAGMCCCTAQGSATLRVDLAS